MTTFERSLVFLAAVLALVLVGLLASGWPDHHGTDRIPTEVGTPLVCGSHGCEVTE